jgi:Domain of unknown function (DUF4136)
MRFIQRLLFLLVSTILLISVYAQEVHYNYDRGANFAAYKTYQWVELPGPGSAVQDQLIDQSIKRAVDEQLAQKGLIKIDENADLQVAYHAIVQEEKGINLSAIGNGSGPWGWGSGWGGFNSSTVTGQTSTIPVGTLLIDLYDPARKQLVWRGDGTKTIDIKKDPDKNYKNLQKAMAKLFKNYPPQAGK